MMLVSSRLSLSCRCSIIRLRRRLSTLTRACVTSEGLALFESTYFFLFLFFLLGFSLLVSSPFVSSLFSSLVSAIFASALLATSFLGWFTLSVLLFWSPVMCYLRFPSMFLSPFLSNYEFINDNRFRSLISNLLN